MLTPDVESMDLFFPSAVQRVQDVNENLENTYNINREAPQLQGTCVVFAANALQACQWSSTICLIGYLSV